MFANRLVRIVSNVDVAVQRRLSYYYCYYYYYYYYSLLPIDWFDKVSDLKRDIESFLFLVHHLNRITIDLSKEEQVIN